MLEHGARGLVSVDSSHRPNGWNGPNDAPTVGA